MGAVLAGLAAGAADSGASREAESLLVLLAEFAVEKLIGGYLCVAGMLIAHPVGIVAGVVGERRDQGCEVPHRVRICLAAGGDRFADEGTLIGEIVEVDRGVQLVDAGAELVDTGERRPRGK